MSDNVILEVKVIVDPAWAGSISPFRLVDEEGRESRPLTAAEVAQNLKSRAEMATDRATFKIRRGDYR